MRAAAAEGPGSMQIFADLCVALVFGGGWLRADARRRGVPAWPWLLAVPFAGSLALVAYVAVREARADRDQRPRNTRPTAAAT